MIAVNQFPALCLLLLGANAEFLKNPPSVAQQLLGIQQCSQHTSCNKCSANPLCHWCGAHMNVDAVGTSVSDVPFGSCQVASTNCSSVKFGNLNSALNFNYWGVAKSQFEVSEVAADSKYCTAAQSPPEITAKNCDECNDLGTFYAWCKMEATAFGLFTVTSPAICLRRDLQFLCNKSIVPPNLPGLFSALKFNIMLQQHDMCGTSNTASLPPPSSKCASNLSCDTCNKSDGGCTWCGGMAKAVVPKISATDPLTANFFGVCVDGQNASCDDVEFGTLAAYMNKIPGGKSSFKVKAMDDSDAYCNTVTWPSVGALQCDDCTKRNDAGWCEITSKVTVSGQKMAINGGFCAKDGLEFACSINRKEKNQEVKSDWYSDSCPSKKAA